MCDQNRQDSARLEDLRRQIRSLRGSVTEAQRRADLCRQALDLVSPQAQPELWAGLHFEWGTCLIQMQAGDRSQNLEDAIARFQTVLEIYTHETHLAAWASVHHNLGVIYRQRLRGDRAENQEEAIRCCERALSVFTPTDWPQDWADATFNLANVYAQRIHGLPRENLERAISKYEQVLRVYTRQANPMAWARVQCRLGEAWKNYHWDDLAANVDKALQYYQAALSMLTLQDHPVEWSVAQHGLGTAWLIRINGDHDDNVTQAIQCFEDALQVRSREISPDAWADTMHNLGVAYLQSYRDDRAKNVEQAIATFEQVLAVETVESGPLKAAEAKCKLADAHFENVRGERAANLEYAIELYHSALQIQRRCGTPQDWGPTLHNLAVAYSERRVGKRSENLQRAAICGRLALRAFDRENALLEWATVETDLIDILWKLANIQRHDDPLGARQNLEDAIVYGERVLAALERQAPSHRQALAHYNLGNAYSDRLAEVQGDNQTAAIYHYEQALRFYTRLNYPLRWADTQNNLAVAYSDRIYGKRGDNLREAIQHYELALQVRTQAAFPFGHRQTQRNLGALHFAERHWVAALAAFSAALEAGSDILAAAYSEAGRRTEVAETSALYTRAAYCQLQLNQRTDAFEQLEAGKTRLLNEALALASIDTANFTAQQKEALSSNRQMIRELEAKMRLPPDTPARRLDHDLAELLRQTRAGLNQLIAAIRQGHPEFMPVGLTLLEILALIPEDGALVAPLITSQGSAVFVVPHGAATVTEDHIIRLDHLTDETLNDLLVGTEANPGWLRAYMNGDRQAWETAIETTTKRLCGKSMLRIHKRLSQLGVQRIVLLPSGGLQLLPLHAAWRMVGGARRYFFDDYEVIYAPSAFALQASRERARSRTGQTALVAGVGDYKQLSPLHFTRTEVEEVGKLLQSQPLMDSTATPDAVRKGASGAAYLHLSCHGSFAWGEDPLASALYLADDQPLTLADILGKMDLNSTRLVTLSACETGISDIRQSPDEYVGLPAGFLQAGAAGVVSSLWSVNDLSTMLLMVRFYEAHLKEGLAPVAALRTAQLWLRDVTAAELSEMSDQYRSVEINVQLRHFALLEPHVKPFAHPYYWAAFAFYGV